MAAMEQTILKYFHSRTVIYQHSYHYDLRCHFFIACSVLDGVCTYLLYQI